MSAAVESPDDRRLRDRRDLRGLGDDRGAIMVMGIFMCTFLVGALWYIAGIGDALVFHERLQESSDSVAFSAAIIDARGMNIIVLMNLLMAAILAIRVAINLLKMICIVAAGIFFALSLIPFCEGFAIIADACAQAAEGLQQADDDTRTAIDDALIALNTAEKGVAYATPAAAWAGSFEMAQKYTPPLSFILLSGATVGSNGYGLPIEDGTTKKLCKEAATAVADIITSIIPGALSSVADTLKGLLVGITANDFFCELGDGGSPPDFSSQLADSNKKGCDGKLAKLTTIRDDAQTKLDQDKAAADGGTNPTVVADQTALDAAQSDVDNFDMGQCQKDLAAQQQQKIQGAQNGAQSNGSSGSSGDKCPAMVKKDWYDGIKDAQISSLGNSSDGNSNATNLSPKFVNIAGNGKSHQIDKPSTLQQLGFSQSEFYYDCSGAWTGSSCNDDQNAMWNFHWRARFRLINYNVNLENEGLQAYEIGMRVKMGADAATAMGSALGSGLPGLQTLPARGGLIDSLATQQLSLH